jgi:hypothetical protein
MAKYQRVTARPVGTSGRHSIPPGQAMSAPSMPTAADPTAYLLYLQRTAGNQAVNRLLQRHAATRPPAVQRAVWQKDFLTDQITQTQGGPGAYAVPLEVLHQILRPGDQYDDSTGIVTRLMGDRVPITALLSSGSPPQGAPPQGGSGGFPFGQGQPQSGGPSGFGGMLEQGTDQSAFAEPRPGAVGQGRERLAHRAALGSPARLARGMTEARKQRAMKHTKTARAENRATLHGASREEEASLVSPADPLMEARLDPQGQPELAFQAGDEVHHLFARQAGPAFRLMIASIPLPIADFILEMHARFEKLKARSQDSAKRLTKKMLRVAKTFTTFTATKLAADAHLGTANTVFANLAATANDKLIAEENLAKALNKLIVLVNSFAKRLDTHFNVPGNVRAPKYVKGADYYTKKMSSAVERYRIEGLVARYTEQPDYPDSDFERDHQPHNDLIETMAALPEFAGKKLRTVAAGRTLLGWSIMLHHDRHAAGRTYGNKGGTVTATFLSDLAAHRATLPTPSAADTRRFCIDYLVQSLKDDAAALKLVANNAGYYADITALVTDATNRAAMKATGAGADPAVIDAAVAAKRDEVKQQILDGEDRMLASESEVRQYDQ